MKKKHEIILLPTNDKYSIIGLYKDTRNLVYNKRNDIPRGMMQHLYLISNEQIREGSWYLANNTIIKADDKFDEGNNPNQNKRNKLIIATTNRKLGMSINGDSLIEKMKDYSDYMNNGKHDNMLPQPSQQFIQEYIDAYNSDNTIKWVNVEYEDKSHTKDCGTLYRGCSPDCRFHKEDKIKVDKNNYISIVNGKDSLKEEEFEKCKANPYYFMTTYATINGEKFKTIISEESFNKYIEYIQNK